MSDLEGMWDRHELYGMFSPTDKPKSRKHSRTNHESKRLAHLHRVEGHRMQEIRDREFERRHHKAERKYELAHHRNSLTERRQLARNRHIGFTGLERKVYEEYKKKGYSSKEARDFAKRTAGKVWAEQHHWR